jgi:two-component system, sensor histidine kinase and response regulator
VNNLRQSGEALLTIINDILDLSKIEAGKLELQISPFEIDEVVSAVADLLYPVASGKDLVLGVIVAPDVPRELLGDPGRLRQILVNLIGNGLKFTDSGGVIVRVDVDTLEKTNIVLRFSVADTGVGIPDEARNRLFQMFSQVDPSSGRSRGGTGWALPSAAAWLVSCRAASDLTRMWAMARCSTLRRGSVAASRMPLSCPAH